MTHMSAPGDTRIIVAADLTQRDTDLVAQPITTGLTATYTLLDWDTGAVVDGPTEITLNESNDWFLSVTTPAEGRYRIKVVVSKDGAQRTLYGELVVKDGTPT